MGSGRRIAPIVGERGASLSGSPRLRLCGGFPFDENQAWAIDGWRSGRQEFSRREISRFDCAGGASLHAEEGSCHLLRQQRFRCFEIHSLQAIVGAATANLSVIGIVAQATDARDRAIEHGEKLGTAGRGAAVLQAALGLFDGKPGTVATAFLRRCEASYFAEKGERWNSVF